MTKPNNFIANSDYLSLAQKSNSEFTAIFIPEVLQPGSYNRTQDFSIPAVKGAIDEIMFSYNGSDYMLGNTLTVDPNNPSMHFAIYRINPSTIRVLMHVYANIAGGYHMPMQTLKIRVSSFLPPNVF